MASELFLTLEAVELRELALEVSEYQQIKKLSDSALLKKFTGLGSTKTYKRILANDLSELSLETQLNNYRSVVALIESLGDDDAEEEDIYDDLWPAVELKRVFFDTSRANGNARVIFLLGPTASGKTSARRVLIERYGQRLLSIEATVVWNDSPMAMLGAILKASGEKNIPVSAVDRLDKAEEILSRSRVALVIEEAHHLGPRCLNLVKTLVNKTPGEFVLLAIDTLWRKLEGHAYEECRQLTGNRLAERILIGGDVRDGDAQKLLERRLTWADPADIKRAVRHVVDKAQSRGRLAFVRDVCKTAAAKAGSDPLTFELFVNAVAEEVASR